jgi:hypothetical protein
MGGAGSDPRTRALDRNKQQGRLAAALAKCRGSPPDVQTE